MNRLILTIASLAILFGCSAASHEEVREAVRMEYLAGTTSLDIPVLVGAMDQDGKWGDIDYQDESRSLWQLEKHLDRLVEMATAYGNDTGKNPELYNAIIRGLNQWFDGKYENPNWWYAKIGVPRRMLAIAYLLDGTLPEDLEKKISKTLDAIDSDDFPARPGGDRIQVLSNHAKVLLWRRDYEGVSPIFKKIEEEARIAPVEDVMYDAGGSPAVRIAWRPAGRGVQSDMSFHHRGDRVDSTLTYGLELPEYFSYWASLLKDTDWEFRPEAVKFIIDYYLDGVSRHLVKGKYAEPAIMNRELSRPGAGVMTSALAERLLALCDGYRRTELLEAFRILEGSQEFSSSYAANFPESAYFAIARPDFQTAVRYHSERNANQEAPHNSEGLRNHFRGDGACMLSATGREYADIAPLFDFRMIPGATTPLIPYEPLSEWGDVQILDSPVKFAGAVSDSIYGAVAFDFISPRLDLNARKGYFFFDDEYVCLGNAINSNSPYEIVTTVEQCLSPEGVMANESGWYTHGGNVYHIIEGVGDGAISRRKGTWKNCVEGVEYADEEKEGDIFTLSISHGVSPHNSRYTYAVSPGGEIGRPHSFQILANEPTHQAVASTDGKLIYIIFYDPASLTTPYGDFSATESCILMIRDGKETKYTNSNNE